VSSIAFASGNRASVFSNNVHNRGSGADIYCEYGFIEVVVDTFTVMAPTEYHASSLENFTFDILNAMITEQVEADLYVSPDGDNSNDGLTPLTPLKTIQHALSIILVDSLHPHTIFLANGIYSPSTNGEFLPVDLRDYLSLYGESEDGVVLNAEGHAGVMRIIEGVDHSAISNMTLTGGSTTYGGGVLCINSSPLFWNVTITDNTVSQWGGGIYCDSSSVILENVSITNNRADNTGGGLFCSTSALYSRNSLIAGNSGERCGGGLLCRYNSSLDLQNVVIHGNSSISGGGICGSECSVILDGVSITDNTATSFGGGIYCGASLTLIFSADNLSSLYSNNVHVRGSGADIWSGNISTTVLVDTFTVMNPTEYHASPLENFAFDILHAANTEQVDADLYVSPDGDNNNDGLTPLTPLKTIQHAITTIWVDSLHPHTIHLAEGVYSPTSNGEFFPVDIRDYLSLSGESETGVILDAEGFAGVIRISDHSDHSSIRNMTLTGGFAPYGGGIYCADSNPHLMNLTVQGNAADVYSINNYGGGIYCSYSNPYIDSVAVIDNSADDGGGIFCSNSSPCIINTVIAGNSAELSGGGLRCVDNSNPTLENVTITGNSVNNYGGGAYFRDSNPSISNVLIAENSSNGGDGYSRGGGMYLWSSSLHLINVTLTDNSADYCGGGIYCNSSSPVLENVILWNNYPQEVYLDYLDDLSITISCCDVAGGEAGIENGTVYWLENNIDADPLFCDPENGDYRLQLDSPCRTDVCGFMGYTGETCEGEIVENRTPVPSDFFLAQNYPNPFNPSTTIEYSLPAPCSVTFSVYNINGQLVDVIQSGFMQAGQHSAVWTPEELPSGVYIYQLKAGANAVSRKMVYVK